MHYLYVSSVDGDIARITDASQIHHLRNVLRLKKGDELGLFDARGHRYRGTIEKIESRQIHFKIIAAEPARPRNLKIAVACAIPKGRVMDDIIDSLTQLDVDVIIPLITERSVVRMDGRRSELRHKRWQKIALYAAEQSQRGSLPQIEPAITMMALLPQTDEYDLKIIPTTSGERTPLREVLLGPKHASVLIAIGPEGDFTPQEVEAARRHGFIPVSLGSTILRVATAAVTATGYVRLALGE